MPIRDGGPGWPIKKPTTFLTNAPEIAAQLRKRCFGKLGSCSRSRGGTHRQCRGHVARLAAVYHFKLCRAILVGMRRQLDADGLTKPGESWKAIEEGRITKDGDFPINPSGGLIGLGHPVGATGVRMLLDCYKQVSGQAGAYQIPQVNNMATFNVGGSTTTCASFIVGVGQ